MVEPKVKIWHCNKCGKKEKIIMDGLCVFCYGGKHGEPKEDERKIKSI